MIDGIGKDAEIIVTETGGKISKTKYDFTLMDMKAMFRLANILYEGAKDHDEWGWRKVSQRDHINHALIHLCAYLDGDTQDDHLGHSFCRLMFAIGTEDKE